jgi:hypothetical protein
MKAALALIFFACIAGSMADQRAEFLNQLIQQGSGIAQTIIAQLQQQVFGIVQNALGQLQTLVGSLGRNDLMATLNHFLGSFKPLLQTVANQALSSVLGSLSGLFSGRVSFDMFGEILNGFWQQIQQPLTGLAQHFVNQGLSAVVGSLGGLLGGRGIGDFFQSISQQISGAVTSAQTALTGVLGNLSTLGANLLDASKPHWEQLQQQLLGHGLNVLGSVAETINNLHGSITTGL